MNSSTELEQYVTMEEYLKGRRCIITGSSGTIGKLFATFIASRGGVPILVDVVPQDDTGRGGRVLRWRVQRPSRGPQRCRADQILLR